jgi:hypothetical protein
MALHRDVFWLGRQWAVTGSGIQAVNKKLEGKFDVEASRLWDDDLTTQVQSETWFDLDDFTQSLTMARKRFLDQPVTFPPPRSDEK